MNYSKIQYYFSHSRINRYYEASNKSKNHAVNLYFLNLKVSKSFNPVLSIFEVILRNKLNYTLSSLFNNTNWIIDEKVGFMNDLSLINSKNRNENKTNLYLLQEILNSEKKLKKLNIPITSCKIISEQSFGFWTCFFDLNYYKILKGSPIKIFKYLPSYVGRKEISDNINKIRRFRNRINHNEPICFNKNKIDFSEAIEVHNAILNLLQWIDPEIIDFINPIDTVLETINKK
jgi:hypothetical protein